MRFKIIALYIIFNIAFSPVILAQSENPETLLCNAGWKKAAWKVVPAMQYRPNRGVESDLLLNERECSKDDYYVFNSDGTYQLLNGENKCTATEGDLISSGKWAFMKNDNRILNLIPGGKGALLQKRILELTEERVVFTVTQIKNGVKYTFTETYVQVQ